MSRNYTYTLNTKETGATGHRRAACLAGADVGLKPFEDGGGAGTGSVSAGCGSSDARVHERCEQNSEVRLVAH